MKKQTSTQGSRNIDHIFAKLPPQAVDVESALLANCLAFSFGYDQIPWLKPEHFYKEAHQIIFKAIVECENKTLVAVTNYLKKTGELESVGGAYYLVTLSDGFRNIANMEYYGRIIQQMFIKREIIRIGGACIQDAYTDSVDCITLFDSFIKQIEDVEQIFDPSLSRHNMISGIENETDHLTSARQGLRFSGLSTGFTHMDDHFRFKPGNFVVVNGHDNVGKTFAMLHLAVCSNKLHGWKWLLCCLENSEGRIRQDIIQSRTGKHISALSDTDYLYWYKWAVDNFIILKIDSEMTADKLLRIGTKLHAIHNFNAFFVDPYNALSLPKEKERSFNSHEYHYEVTNKMRNFIKRTGSSIFLSTHAVTEALRLKHKDGDFAGFPMPPQKADVEGGGKFANRADDFLTIHRYTGHPTESNITHIHVRKIKDTQTGGRPTIVDEPVKLRTVKGYFGLFAPDGTSPIFNISLSQQFPITQSKNDKDQPPF